MITVNSLVYDNVMDSFRGNIITCSVVPYSKIYSTIHADIRNILLNMTNNIRLKHKEI